MLYAGSRNINIKKYNFGCTHNKGINPIISYRGAVLEQVDRQACMPRIHQLGQLAGNCSSPLLLLAQWTTAAAAHLPLRVGASC
jgi:hypothetical protein